MALSQDQDRVRSCTGKARYPTRLLARRGLKRLAHLRRVPLATFQVYLCLHCGRHHIGVRWQAQHEGG